MSDRADPPRIHQPITPPETLSIDCSGIYIGVSGDVTATLGNVTAQYLNLPAGFYLVGEFTHVTAATATGLIAVGQLKRPM